MAQMKKRSFVSWKYFLFAEAYVIDIESYTRCEPEYNYF